METVPETERMEEFKASPVPTLRIHIATLQDEEAGQPDQHAFNRPSAVRRATEPASPSPHSPIWSSPTLPYRPRNTSPYSRGHLRSRSTASALAPPMIRASSMPGLNAAGHLNMFPPRPSSPRGSPNRNRALRKPVDDVFPGMPNNPLGTVGGIPTTAPDDGGNSSEQAKGLERSSSPCALIPGYNLPRIRRPASPLRNLSLQPTVPEETTSNTSYAYSPSYSINRATDSFSNTYNFTGSYSSSSVPSTPTSIRSRSPSISSLETIPDTPDAEEAALEAERIAQLKAAADAADRDGDEAAIDAKRNSSLDTVGSRGRTLGIVYGTRDKRKRWSVCGAERRGDLDLETIWED